jgi:hypothetical protein
VSAAAVLGVRGTMLSDIPLVGVWGGGGLEASSGLDIESMLVAMYSEGRRGVESVELLPRGAGGGRKDDVSSEDSQVFVVSGESKELAVEGLTGVCGVEGRCPGRVWMAMGGDEARMVEERRLLVLIFSS